MILLKAIRSLPTRPLLSIRPFSTSLFLKAGGDTGSVRSGGNAHADTWSRREKAAEDMYIREREKEIMLLLREKIREQEKKLLEDRKLLYSMEDQFGEVADEWAETYVTSRLRKAAV